MSRRRNNASASAAVHRQDNADRARADQALRLEWRTAGELDTHPRNWRRHFDLQQHALRDVIDEVGWAGVLLYNERTRRLIDGHARKQIARADERLPVLVGSWSEADEAKILATLDPLAIMAEHDLDILADLTAGIETESAALRQVIEDVTAQVLTFDDLPETVKQNAEELQAIHEQQASSDEGVRSKMDTERYLVIVCRDREQRQAILGRLGLPHDERYLSADSVELRKRSVIRASGYKAAPPGKAGATG